ncbi:MAG: fructosamine kinase family protein [Gammaproteobacteria bacterium]|jgi:protein-ribulosamine 3-kinase|nr:fructosamine kinase family protein [Gammaproteobacteria bacterium]
MLEQIANSIGRQLEQTIVITDQQQLSGGSINQVSCISLDNGSKYLLKTQSGVAHLDIFKIEHESLLLLAEAKIIKVPVLIIYGDNFLVMEYINEGIKAKNWQEQLGRNLALLHQHTQQELFGFHCNNYLGTSLQINSWKEEWIAFWSKNRLEPQLKLLAERVGLDDPLLKKGLQLLDNLEFWLGQITEPAVLLHGDLWSGNAMADDKGGPVIFDPACYYGHREAEFGIMRMFGGFGPRCEAAYAEIWPFADGYKQRFRLYQLHHELNHLLLFGQAYYSSSLASLNALQ